MKSWYAVWTRSRHEQAVCKELGMKSVDTFLPTVARVSRWKDRRKTIAWPLFPGYCFARLDAADLPEAFCCHGVVTVLSTDEGPVRIPDAEIDGLKRLMESGVAFETSPALGEGAMVEVVSGPLAGVVGRMVDRRRRDQLVLAIDALRSGARVEVSAWDIRPI